MVTWVAFWSGPIVKLTAKGMVGISAVGR
jgi:hypothetical protein